MVAAFGYAVMGAFGAWTVVRRRPRLAFLFMTAASILTVGGVAAAYRLPESWWLLALGAVGSSLASYLNARLVLGRVLARNHVGRALAGLLLVLVAAWALG